MTASSPFDDVRDLLARLPERDRAIQVEARPELGRLGGLAAWVASWQGKPVPTADRALVAVFASSHGVALRLGRGDPCGETRARLDAFAAGATATNAICAAQGLGFKAFDLAVDLPTGDITHEPAMDEKACVATMAFGMELIAGGTDLIAVGEAGIGAEIVAAALLCALYHEPPAAWADEARLGTEATSLVTQAVLRQGREGDPLTMLASLGGRDLAAMAGAILAARLERIPVILDGFAAAAAAAILHAVNPEATAHCLAGHGSGHPRHGALLQRLGLEPLLQGLGILAGEGVGAALAAGVVRTAVAINRDSAAAVRPAPVVRH